MLFEFLLSSPAVSPARRDVVPSCSQAHLGSMIVERTSMYKKSSSAAIDRNVMVPPPPMRPFSSQVQPGGTPHAVLQAQSLSESLPAECKATQCMFRLGNQELPVMKRLWSFSSRGDGKRQFNCKHLRHHPDRQPIACPHPRSDIDLSSKMHLQDHAAVAYKTPT